MVNSQSLSHLIYRNHLKKVIPPKHLCGLQDSPLLLSLLSPGPLLLSAFSDYSHLPAKSPVLQGTILGPLLCCTHSTVTTVTSLMALNATEKLTATTIICPVQAVPRDFGSI